MKDENGGTSVQKIKELEYSALKAEGLKRVEMRLQILQMTLTIAGVLIGVAVQLGNSLISLIYPPLAFCLAMLWAQNDIRSRQVADFIGKAYEREPAWERLYKKNYSDKGAFFYLPFSIIASGGTFIITELLAIVLGLVKRSIGWAWWVMITVDTVFFIATVWMMILAHKAREQTLTKQELI